MSQRSSGGAVSVAPRAWSLGWRLTVILAAALAFSGITTVLGASEANAKEYPGAAQVRAAQAAVRNQASTVADLDAAVVQLEEAVHAAEVATLQAQDVYSQKQWENQEAQRQLFIANSRADEAENTLESARSDLAIVAMASYREGGSLGSLEAIMTANGFEDVITRSEALDRASDDAAAVIEEVRAAELFAQTMRKYAQVAADNAVTAEQASEDALLAAKQAEADAQTAYAEAAAAQAAALARLAELRRVSAELEGARQAGLAQERANRAYADAQLRALLAAQASQYFGLTPEQLSDPNITPIGGTSVGTAEQGQIAVLFALSHVGDAYVYGAAGPSTWDCSGLTMVSWRTAGVYLPRSSRGQYGYVGKIPYTAMRVGDLIFFGTGTAASSVYHVTMYIGNNMIVEAPHPGDHVKTRDYRLWSTSNLMPFAGRP